MVEKSEIIDGTKVGAGDALIALASSGPHSNGFSLIRKILEVSNADLQQPLGDATLADALMEPTRIYVKPVLALIKKFDIHALSHITGGGFWENIPRVLPNGTKAVVDGASWQWPAVFSWLQTAGNVETKEMYRTFNCGVGMVIALPADQAAAAVQFMQDQGEQCWLIGHIDNAAEGEEQVEIK